MGVEAGRRAVLRELMAIRGGRREEGEELHAILRHNFGGKSQRDARFDHYHFPQRAPCERARAPRSQPAPSPFVCLYKCTFCPLSLKASVKVFIGAPISRQRGLFKGPRGPTPLSPSSSPHTSPPALCCLCLSRRRQ